jgi:glycosyltransferase involved in cell wall biosynthesis
VPAATPTTLSIQTLPNPNLCVAVLVPCLNEELTVGRVTTDFLRFLPGCAVWVYDNNSSDRTAEVAKAAGTIVRRERYPGKGKVVRRMFADVHADVYLLVDADDTYDARAGAAAISRLVVGFLDFVNIARVATSAAAYPPGHRTGNIVLTGAVRLIFGRHFRDMLSGFKVLSHRFVKSFPALSQGFEIETELTIHALELRMPAAEISAPYSERAACSVSKLRRVRDGFRILCLIARLLRDERPLWFFGVNGLAAIIIALGLGVSVIESYLQTGLVPRLPTALLSVGLVLAGLQSIGIGLILDTVRTGRHEARRLAYLQFPSSAAQL